MFNTILLTMCKVALFIFLIFFFIRVFATIIAIIKAFVEGVSLGIKWQQIERENRKKDSRNRPRR